MVVFIALAQDSMMTTITVHPLNVFLGWVFPYIYEPSQTSLLLGLTSEYDWICTPFVLINHAFKEKKNSLCVQRWFLWNYGVIALAHTVVSYIAVADE
jgi:hypothetical protein